MKLKLARTTIKAKPKTIELKKVEEDLANKSIFYFDKDNSHKDMIQLIEGLLPGGLFRVSKD